MIRFEAKSVLPLSTNRSDFISNAVVKRVVIVAPNVLLAEDEIFYFTDFHMGNEIERFGVSSDKRKVSVSNAGEKIIRLYEAVYLGSVLDFIYYESVVYTLAKYQAYLKSNLNHSPRKIILNEGMSKHTRDFLISSINKEFSECEIILMDKATVIEVENLNVFTLNDQLLDSNLENLSSYIRSLTTSSTNRMYAGSKILLTRKKQVFFSMKSRKPRNSRVFELYAKYKGYEVFDPGGMKFQDVLERMACASEVVSYHGGGLVNLLACKPGTRVSEIYSEWYSDCFEKISVSCKLDYTSYFYEMKKRPDLIRTAYYLLFKMQRKAYRRHFRIKYRDFNSILQV